MDIQPQTAKPISDDQELAKVLAGITQQPNNNLGFEELSAPNQPVGPVSDNPTNPLPTPSPIAEPNSNTSDITNNGVDNLESIKKSALLELRPLVDKLDLAPDEKFNIYLLLLRSTDDKTLIAPAHKAAADIPDETKRAQALLDIIKEIDYFSNAQK